MGTYRSRHKSPYPNRLKYVPEPAYFLGDGALPLVEVGRIVGACIAQFATRYVAWPVNHPSLEARGTTPHLAQARRELVDQLFSKVRSWLNDAEAPEKDVGILLYDDD